MFQDELLVDKNDYVESLKERVIAKAISGINHEDGPWVLPPPLYREISVLLKELSEVLQKEVYVGVNAEGSCYLSVESARKN